MMSKALPQALMFLLCEMSTAAPTLRGEAPASNISKSRLLQSYPHAACCSGCQTSFCSPVSGTCYEQKGKDYYLECAESDVSCCTRCGTAFCSPQSGRCYENKGKDYYVECEVDVPPGLNYAFVKTAGCGPNSREVGQRHFVGTTWECAQKCKETEGCIAFLMQDSGDHGQCPAAQGLSECRLFTSCLYEENSCWEVFEML